MGAIKEASKNDKFVQQKLQIHTKGDTTKEKQINSNLY